MGSTKSENGESTRRSLVITSESALTPDELIGLINNHTEWKASRSQHLAVMVEKGEVQIELKRMGDHAFKTVNVSPQDGEHRHVPIEEDALSELAPALESLNKTVAWVLADKDKITTRK
ncbi:hypothetical protein Jab_1c23860 [Janthinobacterium sp. HH01]|uniref:hypothetical protein n=1 Tax=Janthinobacterium sp. HH01 TaxID=1198452 RepID=UPI0002AE8E1F|nr:hypothetical protein [Janthinobacterium sp. HH01]ELX13748.1 hypothetical protein Jab_1c23860 [Janthinobacterium sp. HH01]